MSNLAGARRRCRPRVLTRRAAAICRTICMSTCVLLCYSAFHISESELTRSARTMKHLAVGCALIIVALSLFTFVAYGFDKRRARKGGRRVPEKTLHILSLLGGWPGAVVGQQVFRHKTQKVSFRIMFWLCVMLHLAVVGGIGYLLHSQG